MIIGFEPADISSVYVKLDGSAENILLYDVGYGAPDDRSHILYYENGFIAKNTIHIETVFSFLSDDLSKKTLSSFI